MIEDILAEMASQGFVVSNTFQVGEGDPQAFGRGPQWQVYLRNTRNTRTGMATAETLEGAFRAAFAKALEGPTFGAQRPAAELAERREVHRRAALARLPHPILSLGDTTDDTTDAASDLF
jgi:hypothetical protein